MKYIVWNVNNKINIGFLSINYYSIIFLLSFIIGFFIIKNIYKIDKINSKYLDSLLLCTIFGTIIGARLGQVVFYDFLYFRNNIYEALFPIKKNINSNILGIIYGYEFIGYRGLSSHGAAIGITISTIIYSKYIIKKHFLWIFDRLCIPISLGSSLIRIGNFFNSEIIGKPSKLPWAINFMKMSSDYGPIIPRHPAQLYESISYFFIFILILYLYLFTNKKKLLGYIFGFFLVLISITRIILEFFKEPQGKELINIYIFNSGQLLTFPFLILGILIFLLSFNLKRKNNIDIL